MRTEQKPDLMASFKLPVPGEHVKQVPGELFLLISRTHISVVEISRTIRRSCSFSSEKLQSDVLLVTLIRSP